MSSFLTSLTQRGSIPVLERMTAFTEAHNNVIAENIANVDTPGYRTQQVDVDGFRAELRRASKARRSDVIPESLDVRDSLNVKFDSRGDMMIESSVEPTENLAFHDGTNGRVERQMAMLAANGMMNNLAGQLLKNRYDFVMTAIRGRVS